MKRVEVQKIILQTIAAAVVIPTAIVAPNALQALKIFGIGRSPKSSWAHRIDRTVKRLVDKGLLVLEYKNGHQRARLTKLGQKHLRNLELRDYKIAKPKHWDRKWRIVIFDISEKKRKLRDQIRLILTRVGFKRLQHSVWVYPYPCNELVALVKAELILGKDALYIIAERIENDENLKKFFKLMN